MWRNQKLDRPFLVTVAMLWLVNRRSGAGFSKPSIHANQQTGSQRVSKVSSWNKQNNSRLDLDCSESENTETETLEEYDKQINMVSFWRMTANLVIYYPHWNLHKVVHYILYPIFIGFIQKHIQKCAVNCLRWHRQFWQHQSVRVSALMCQISMAAQVAARH